MPKGARSVPEPVDPYQFLSYLRDRWRVIAGACAVGAILALFVSLLLPKQYTATARIFIEPPAGSDVRASVAVSPIYLESLKTYEHFAASDSLFEKALEQFGLRGAAPARSIESWKRRVLKVDIPRNTRILEINVTLSDPRKAKEMAQFIAEQTVGLSRSVSREGDAELVKTAEQQFEEAKAARDRIEEAWSQLLAEQPTAPIAAELDSLASRRYTLERSLVGAEAALAGNPRRAELSARVEYYRDQLEALERDLAKKQALLAARTARREKLEAGRSSATTAFQAAETRLREVRASVGLRGERLNLVDPGIVPERPSSPHVFLNVLSALLVALVASTLYLTLHFGYRAGQKSPRPSVVRIAAHDD
jgi:capsular polysaccharide biosynthesis protein